jgi:hypothetical protein
MASAVGHGKAWDGEAIRRNWTSAACIYVSCSLVPKAIPAQRHGNWYVSCQVQSVSVAARPVAVVSQRGTQTVGCNCLITVDSLYRGGGGAVWYCNTVVRTVAFSRMLY